MLGLERLASLLRAIAHVLEAPVFELDPCFALTHRNESDFDLGQQLRAVLPVRADAPRQQETR
jgi:hypothetical protein